MDKKIIAGLFALSLTACASGVNQLANQPREVWTNFTQEQVSAQNLAENQALVVFYRQDDVTGPAVNVYVGGDYQASLLPNAYTAVAVCATQQHLSSAFSTNTAFPERFKGVNYTFTDKGVTYVKVTQQANGKLSFTRVDNEAGQQAVAQLQKENQTLSRVKAQCDTGVKAFASLDASGLFKFNQSSYQSIEAKGQAEIQAFAEQVKTMPNVSKIEVAGHTDPLGSDAYNKVLSQKRAETVKKALEQAGVTAPITAVGYGESKPVVNCEGSGAQLNQCNMPNRRVEIAVYTN